VCWSAVRGTKWPTPLVALSHQEPASYLSQVGLDGNPEAVVQRSVGPSEVWSARMLER
jgi:hypothetical protein